MVVSRFLTRSCWNGERYIGGSYSYHKIGQTAADCDVLAKQVPSTGVSQFNHIKVTYKTITMNVYLKKGEQHVD